MLFEDDAVLIDCGFTFDETKFLSQELTQLKDIVSLKPFRADTLELHLKQVTTHIDEYKGKMTKKTHILFTEDDKHIENIFQRLLIHKQRLELFISNKNKFNSDQILPATTITPSSDPTPTTPTIAVAAPVEKEIIEKIVIQSDPIVIERCNKLESELVSKEALLAQLEAQIVDLNNQQQELTTKHQLELQTQQEQLEQAQSNKTGDVVQDSLPLHNEDEFLEPVDTITLSTHDRDNDAENTFEEGTIDDQNPNSADAAYQNKNFRYKTARLAPEHNAFQTNYIEELLQKVERLTAENTTLSTKSLVSEADYIYYQVLSQQRQSEIDQWELYANQQDFKINQLQGEITQLTLILLEQAQKPRDQPISQTSTPVDVAVTTECDSTMDTPILDEKEQADTPSVTTADTTETVLTIIPAAVDVEDAQPVAEEAKEDHGVETEKIGDNIAVEFIPVISFPDNVSTTSSTTTTTNVTYVEPSSQFQWDEEEFLQDEINFRSANDTAALDEQIVQLRQKLSEYDSNLINHGEDYYLPRDSRKRQRILLHISRLTSVQSGNGAILVPSPQTENQHDQQLELPFIAPVVDETKTNTSPLISDSNDESNNNNDLEKEKYLTAAREVVELSKEILLQAQTEAETLKAQVQSQDESLLELRSQLSTEEQERRRLLIELGDEREIKRTQKKQIEKLQGDNVNLVERNATLVDKYEFCLLNHSPVHDD